MASLKSRVTNAMPLGNWSKKEREGHMTFSRC